MNECFLCVIYQTHRYTRYTRYRRIFSKMSEMIPWNQCGSRKGIPVGKNWEFCIYVNYQCFLNVRLFGSKLFDFDIVQKITTQKIKLSIKDCFSKCEQIRRNGSHLLKKFLIENFIFCAMNEVFCYEFP